MRIAISITITEPPIESAASESPIASRTPRPKNIARRSITIAIAHSRAKTMFFRSFGTFFRHASAIGMLPSGSAISTMSVRAPQKPYSIVL